MFKMERENWYKNTRKIPRKVLKQIKGDLKKLHENISSHNFGYLKGKGLDVRPIKKFNDNQIQKYALRVGYYRIEYTIEENQLNIKGIYHRDKAYKK